MEHIEISSPDELKPADIISIKTDGKSPLYETIRSVLDHNPKVCFCVTTLSIYFDEQSHTHNEFKTICEEYGYACTLYKTNKRKHSTGTGGLRAVLIFWRGNLCPKMEYFEYGMPNNTIGMDILLQAKKFIKGQLPMLNCKFVKQNNMSQKIDYAELFEPKLF